MSLDVPIAVDGVDADPGQSAAVAVTIGASMSPVFPSAPDAGPSRPAGPGAKIAEPA